MTTHEDDYRPSSTASNQPGAGNTAGTLPDIAAADDTPGVTLPEGVDPAFVQTMPEVTKPAARGAVASVLLPPNQAQAPLQALPIDTTPGSWIPIPDEAVIAERAEGLADTEDFNPAPVPLIGTVTVAGEIVQGATVSVPALGWVDIGELQWTGRPSALELQVIAAAVGLEIQGQRSGTSQMAGFPIPSTRELRIRARSAHIHNTTGAAVLVSYMLVALGVQA